VGTEALNQVGFSCRCQHSVLVTPKISRIKIIKSISMSLRRLPRIAPQGNRPDLQVVGQFEEYGL